MDNKGFSLAEFLGCLGLMAVVLLLGVVSSRKTITTSLSQLRTVSDNEVFTAARSYASDNKILFKYNDYICVSVEELIDKGYMEETYDNNIKNKLIQINGNTKKVKRVKYVNRCN